jgi:hypothetical protein
MQVPQFVLVFVLALAGAGCMKPNPLIYTLGDGGEDATGSETGDGDGDPGDGDPLLPDMLAGESCEQLGPLEPLAISCGECLAADCCDLVLACVDVGECLCLADCVIEGGSPGTCKNTCSGVSPGQIDELAPLLECATTACNQAC